MKFAMLGCLADCWSLDALGLHSSCVVTATDRSINTFSWIGSKILEDVQNYADIGGSAVRTGRK